jgi:hypothetical protein
LHDYLSMMEPAMHFPQFTKEAPNTQFFLKERIYSTVKINIDF